MTRFVYSLACVVVAASPLSAVAVAAAVPAHYTISAEQISTAISDAGMAVSPEQIKLLTQVRATTDAPRLKVESIQRSGNNTAIVRMGCLDSTQCLPFFVKAELNQNGGSEAAPASSVQVLPSLLRAASKQPVMRAGAQAVLLLESERVHIRIPVVCIENGALGQKVRVRASGNRQLYVAEVVDATSLKGSL
jgi:hypothetical protein